MQLKRKIAKVTAVALSAVLVGLFGTAEYYSSRLPCKVVKGTDEELRIAEYPEITCCGSPIEAVPVSSDKGGTQHQTLSLFGAIPVKNVEVEEVETPELIAGGNPFGIKLLMKGVMVTELGEVKTQNGSICPAREAGIEAGDVIKLADGHEVMSNGELQEIISEGKGKNILLTIERGGKNYRADLIPVYSEESGTWKGGMWVRDSIAGIGTMTFADKETGKFAGLGHPVCDSDTGEIVPVYSGEAVPVEISSAKRGEKGIPGELRGHFEYGDSYGILNDNKESGVYGRLSEKAFADFSENGRVYKMGYRQDITTGEAYILTTVSGNEPEMYSIEIESIDYNSDEESKNMTIRITDQRLIDATGGIVQGMSGSPIIQNDRLVGAVTHVFVADPTKGYGIFAENMIDFQ